MGMCTRGYQSCIDLLPTDANSTCFSLHRYLADVVHVDMWWFIGNRLDVAPEELPAIQQPITGSSAVQWRYHFNTGIGPHGSDWSMNKLLSENFRSYFRLHGCLLVVERLGVSARLDGPAGNQFIACLGGI